MGADTVRTPRQKRGSGPLRVMKSLSSTGAGNVLRLVAIGRATEARGEGLGWCPDCTRGGWIGPRVADYKAAERAIGRVLTVGEIRDFSRDFLHMIRFFPAVACWGHARDNQEAAPCLSDSHMARGADRCGPDGQSRRYCAHAAWARIAGLWPSRAQLALLSTPFRGCSVSGQEAPSWPRAAAPSRCGPPTG